MSFFGKKADHRERAMEAEVQPHAALPARARYGIDDAIQLMRTLPLNQNADLILLVIRNTLASMNVDLKEVIDDGGSKQERLRGGIATLGTTIAELERDIAVRKQEVAALEADLAETTTVRERLEAVARREDPILQPSIGVSPSKPSARPPKPGLRSPPPPPPHAVDAGDRSTMDIDPLPESRPDGTRGA